MNNVKVESNQASAAGLWHAVRGAERLGTTHTQANKILQILLNLLYYNLCILLKYG
jgi:hypothetical protein